MRKTDIRCLYMKMIGSFLHQTGRTPRRSLKPLLLLLQGESEVTQAPQHSSFPSPVPAESQVHEGAWCSDPSTAALTAGCCHKVWRFVLMSTETPIHDKKKTLEMREKCQAHTHTLGWEGLCSTHLSKC